VISIDGMRSTEITYTDPTQAIVSDFFTLYSMSSMWVARAERVKIARYGDP